MVDLSLLVTFLAVHRHRSFTAAARAVGVAQPTVTVQIRALERQLDQQLFVRGRGGSEPTSAADVLMRRIAPHVDALTRAVQLAVTPPDPFSRPVHLAGPAEFIERRVLPALADLYDRGLRLRVTAGLALDLLDGLHQGRYDLVVSTVRPRLRGITATPLTDEELLLLGAPGVAGVPADRLESLPFLSYDEDLSLFRRYWKVAFGRLPAVEPRIVVADLRALAAACAAGAGISVLPRYLVADQLAAGHVVPVHDTPDGVINTLYLAWRASGSDDPAAAAVRERLREAAASW